MASYTTIDAAGRVVIPKKLREQLRLLPNSRLRITEEKNRVVLEPIEEDPVLIERGGVVLIGGELTGGAPDARQIREERIQELTRRTANKRPA
ncbi:MAG TPA: AbrB/MazE/SpoVT family DNA-binding domain-containing protein [Candidatus Binatia bacterium]|nr:AbrB/MazE/SpoVT family DNA-binding domain-containing protein [Candidatus Binatia bacterium]